MSEGIYSTAKRKLQEEKIVEKEGQTTKHEATLEAVEQAESRLKFLIELSEDIAKGRAMPAKFPEEFAKAAKTSFSIYTNTFKDLIDQLEKSRTLTKEQIADMKITQTYINSQFTQLLTLLESIWHEKHKNANLENETLLRVNRILDVTERNMI